MANADNAYGFIPVNMDGSPYNGATMRCVFAAGDATATFIGDAVKIAGTSINGSPTIAQCAAGDPVLGVVTIFEASPATSLEDQYRKASTERYCQVAMAHGGYFMIQDDSDAAALPITEAGDNADFIVGTGSTVTGLSAMEIDESTATTTSTLDLQLWGPVFRDDNEAGSANADWIVSFNDPQTKPFRTGV